MGFESLYIGSTGLQTHSTRMQNIGNNLANVNTLGYKTTNVHFETLISEHVVAGRDPAKTGLSQSGKGVGLGAILTDFRNGGVMAGNATTDLAINGKGFFRVQSGDVVRYTRAGNFRFDKEGFLVDPNGFRVQGQEFVDGTAGSTGDIQLPINANGQITMAPEATTEVTMGMNIGSLTDKTVSAANPYFSMFESWNGAAADGIPLADSAYGYKNTIKIYDANGTARELDVYLDAVSVSNAAGKSYFEFVVSTPPGADNRTGVAGTSGAGAAMIGTMVFNSTGELENVSAFTYSGTGGVKDLANWTQSTFDANGNAVFNMQFTGVSSATTTTSSTATGDIGMNFGLSANSWSNTVSNASIVGHNQTLLPQMASPTRTAFASTHFEGSSATIFQKQDGSAEGFLTNLNVNADGILVGNFSNGEHKDLHQITTYTFINEWGLRREGGNHFSATNASGEAEEGTPNSSNRGAIAQNTLETSNVDMATEFTKMIVTERGFQANSKVITTTDQILQVLYQMKR